MLLHKLTPWFSTESKLQLWTLSFIHWYRKKTFIFKKIAVNFLIHTQQYIEEYLNWPSLSLITQTIVKQHPTEYAPFSLSRFLTEIHPFRKHNAELNIKQRLGKEDKPTFDIFNHNIFRNWSQTHSDPDKNLLRRHNTTGYMYVGFNAELMISGVGFKTEYQ